MTPRFVDPSEANGHAIPLLDDEYEMVKSIVLAFNEGTKLAMNPIDTTFELYMRARDEESKLPEHACVLLDALMLHLVHKNIIGPIMQHFSTKLAGAVVAGELGRVLEKVTRDAFPPKREFMLECHVGAMVGTKDDLALILQVRDNVQEFALRMIREVRGKMQGQAPSSNVTSILDAFLDKGGKDAGNNPNRPASKD